MTNTAKITKTTVQAKSRVLSTKYTVEEPTNILAEEIRKEIDWQLLTELCDNTTTFNFRYDNTALNLDEIEQWVRDNTAGRITKAELGIFINFDGNKSAASLFKIFWM